MKITYDPYADAMYIYLNGIRKSKKTEQVRDDLLIDFDTKNQLMGIEMLDVSKKMSKKSLKSIDFELNLEKPKPRLTR